MLEGEGMKKNVKPLTPRCGHKGNIFGTRLGDVVILMKKIIVLTSR
jgi:hypothetical protein